MSFVAYINRIEPKGGVSKKTGKPYTLYNVYGTTKEGEEVRVGWGFDKPTFDAGVWIKTELEQNGAYLNYKGAAVEVKAGGAPNKPANESGNSFSGGGGDRQASIIYQSSRKDALHLVEILLSSDALPITGAKTKAGEAKRFDEIQAIVDKLTVRFYHDVDTLRLLEAVEDAGIGEEAEEEELPDVSDVEEEEDDDDIPF